MPDDSDFDLLVAAVREAGALALEFQRREFRQWHKPDGSLVTEGDLAVNALLEARLAKTRPGYGWLAEESPLTDERLAAEHCWIVDPIDGTRDFAARGTMWCVGAALTSQGHPVVACLCHPQLGRLYTARKGHGTFLNGERLGIADSGDIEGARVMGAKAMVTPLVARGAEAVPSRDTPMLARLAMVASGELDIVVAQGPKHDWDLAAGELLITEAGGVVTDHGGNPLHYNQLPAKQPGLVAAGAARHKTALHILEHT